MMTTAGGIL